MRLSAISMKDVNRAFAHARDDLRDVGLLADGQYLDRIDCYRAWLPSFGELGYVYDEKTPWLYRLVGFEAGAIFLPLNPDVKAYVPGGTLVDTIRHEFGHSWAWLDRKFIDGRWFRDAFGGRYGDDWAGDEPESDRMEFVSDYACTRPGEDFCETFMTFLRCRRSLHRFDGRPGVKRKLSAVASAVSIAAKERVPRVRGPR